MQFIFLIGYIGPAADRGERGAQRGETDHPANKAGNGKWADGSGTLRNSMFIGGNAREEGEKRGNSVIFRAIRTMSSYGLVMRRAQMCTVPTQPRNILTKGGGYTISLFKE